MGSQPGGVIDIYGRISRASDDRQRSVQGQVQDCRGRLDERDLTIGVIHVDNSRSAWNARVHRPGWDALMERLESGAAGGVIVFDLARFSRRPIEGERLIAAAERGLLVLDSENEYDLTTANGKKQFRDQMSGAAYESDRLSTRVKRGKRLAAKLGGAKPSGRPFGFLEDGVTPHPTEAPVLREMSERVLAGDSQDGLIADLNRRGILTAHSKTWTRTGVRDVLCRARNAGLVEHLGQVVAKLPGEPVVDVETWERVRAMYAARRTGRPPSDTYLSSGIALCELCRQRLAGRPRPEMKPYPDGAVRRQYWCRRTGGSCGRIAIDQRRLDAAMGEFTITVLSDARHAGAIEAAAREASSEAAALDTAVAEAEHVALELAGRLGRGEIDLSRHDAAAKPLDRRLAELRAKRVAIGEVEIVDVAGSRAEWEARWESATTPERRILLRMALRGRPLLIGPAPRRGSSEIASRIKIGEPQ